MALDRLTKIDGGGISTTSDYRVGVITATKFVGPIDGVVTGTLTGTATTAVNAQGLIGTPDITVRNIKATGLSTFVGDAQFDGNVSIAGTLTYEDVTNIDSVGIITARDGIDCNADLDVDGHTNLDNVSVAGVSTFSDDVTFTGTTGNIVFDKSDNSLNIKDGTGLKIGDGADLHIYHGGAGLANATFIDESGVGRLRIRTNDYVEIGKIASPEMSARFFADGACELYHDNVKRLETSAKGIQVGTGVTIETNGQAEIAGITTFYKDVHIKSATNRLYLGTTDRLSLIADPSHSYLRNSGSGSHFQIHSDNFSIRSYQGNGSITLFYSPVNDGSGSGGPRLYHNHGSGIILERLRTTTSGVNITGVTTTTGLAVTGVSTFTGNIDANGDLDVDGHTNLDNVSIAGVSTFSDNISIGGNFTAGRKVHIKDSGQIKLENTSTGSWAGLEFLGSSGTNNYDAYMGVQDSDGLFFIDNNSNGIDFCITQGGKIGITQTSPYSDVDITSSVEDSTGTLSAHGIRLAHVGATDEEVIPITAGFKSQQDRARAGIGFISKISGSSEGYAGAIGFYTRSSADGNGLYRTDEKVRIDSSGRVLMGTTTAGTGSGDDLTISNSGNMGLTLRSTSSNYCNIYFSDATSGTATYEGYISYNHATDSLEFATGHTERLRIDSSGHVMIGTTTEGFATYGDQFTIANSGHCGMTIRSGSSSDGNIYFSDGTSGADEVKGFVEYNHSSNFMQLGTDGSARIRITSAGDVGIGYNSPTVKLHIREAASGASSYDNRYHIIVEDDAESYLGFYVPSSGYAGVRFSDNTGLEGYIDYYFGTDEFVYASTSEHYFKTGGTERLRINSAGGLKLSNTAGGHLLEYGGSTVNTVAAIDIYRLGNGYADIRLSSNYGATLRLAGASNNTDEYQITQDNQKNAYHNLQYDGFINFVTNNTTQAMRLQSGKVSINKNIETLTGNGFAAALQVNNKTTDGYGTIMMGGGYNRGTIGIGNVYDLILTSNAYPANASTGGIKFRCGTSGGGGPHERFRIHQDGMLETRQNGTAKTYWFSSGITGGYSQLQIIIDAHAYHSFIITVAHGGYAGSWTTSKFMGYENGSLYYPNEGTETTDSNSRNATHSHDGGHKHKILITGGMGTHPGCELRLTICGPDAYIDTGDVAFTWS